MLKVNETNSAFDGHSLHHPGPVVKLSMEKEWNERWFRKKKWYFEKFKKNQHKNGPLKQLETILCTKTIVEKLHSESARD